MSLERKRRSPGVCLAFLVIGVLLLPEPLRGAVAGSPHDLVSQGYDVNKTAEFKDECGPCHLPRTRKGWDLLARVPASLRDYPPSSLLCFSCHDGTTIVNDNVDASMTAFHPLSHGYDPASYGDTFRPPENLPLSREGHMACTSCHDPHDNEYRPFLRLDISLLCRACHEGKVEDRSVKGNLTGNHPIMVDPFAAPKREIPLQVDAKAYQVAFPLPYPMERGKESSGTHWDLGGHLSEGLEGGLECVTCHAVHGDEESPPLKMLLSRDPVRAVSDAFCEGCHRGRRGDGAESAHAPNPGGTVTGRTYHPCDDDEANSPGRSAAVTEPEGWPLGTGSPARLLCVTCHRPHDAEAGTALLRSPGKERGFCEACHDDIPSVYHHPVETDREGGCAEDTSALDDEGRGYLLCQSCHRAHNAGLGSENEEGHIPLLRENLVSDDYCTRCHPEEDPTCEAPESGHASHFLGDPTLSGTYDKEDPAIRTKAWPETGLYSLYGGSSGKAILCLSCHAFKEGALTPEDASGSKHLVARSGPDVEWDSDAAMDEGGTGVYLCTGCHSANPSTNKSGHTHPLMSADISKLKEGVKAPMTSTPGGHINCDSCHLPHGALDEGGVYIMKVITGPNTDPKAIHPMIDYTVTCHQCHPESEY